MSHTMIIGINRQEARSASDLSVALDKAFQTDVQEALFHGSGYVAMLSGGSHGSALFTCPEGIFATPGFLDVMPGALSNAGVAVRYAEDCMKAFLKRHGVRAKIEGDRVTKSPSADTLDMLFVAIEAESLKEVSVEAVHEAISAYVEKADAGILSPQCLGGLWVDPVMKMTRPVIGLHAMTSEIETVQVWEEVTPLYGQAIKITEMSSSLREYLHLSYLLSAVGSYVVLSKEQKGIQDGALVMGMKLVDEVA